MTVWTIKGGSNGEHEDAFLEDGFIAIGYGLQQSIADFADRDALRLRADNQTGANQMWRFYTEIKDGDTVALPRKRPRGLVAVGRINGPYVYQPELVGSGVPHTRSVEWQVTNVPRSHFDQDLLNSFGSLQTLSQPQAPNAEARIRQIANIYLELETAPLSGPESGQKAALATAMDADAVDAEPAEEERDLDQEIKDRIVARLRQRYAGTQLEYLVATILKASGYHVLQTREGPDGGIDILAGKGDMGFGEPRLCIQVKGRTSPVNLQEYASLQGNINAFGAQYGLLVSLGGFTKPVHERNEQQSFFIIRLWGSDELAQRLLENYDSLPPDIRADFRADLPVETARILQRQGADL